jgi:hypothetical protein
MTLSPDSIFRLPLSEINPTMQVLNDHGVNLNHLDMLRANDGDSDYARRVCHAFVNGAFPSSTDTRIARLVFGNSLFEMADWVRFFAARFGDDEVQKALLFPWHEDVLMSADPWEPKKLIKDTHAAFWGVEKIGEAPLTVAQLIKMHPDEGKVRYFYPTSWHDGQPHVHVATLAPRWHLLRVEIVPGSTGKLPDEHVKNLPAEYELPTTVAETAKDQFVFRKTGKRPNGSKWAHCAETTIKTDKCSVEYPSVVCYFDERGLSVYYWSGVRSDDVGCGASRKI